MPWSEFPVPRSETNLVPAWFAAAFPSSMVESVAIERLPGLLNPPFRVSLAYSPGSTPGPQSVIAKMGRPAPSQSRDREGASDDQAPGSLQGSTPTNLPVTDREFLFYRDLAPHLPVDAPRLLYSLAGSDGHFVLLLEDLALRHEVRPFEAGDLPLAVETLGRRLHTRYWASPELAQRPYLRTMADLIDRVEQRLDAGVPVLLDRFEGTLDEGQRTLLERLPSGFRRAAGPLTRAPATLCHHDLSGRNLFVQGAGAGRDIIFIDWQLVQAVPGVRDLSFLIGCEGVELDADHERALLQRYHAGLLAQGVGGYSFDRLVEDYRRSIICDFGRMAMTASNPDLIEGMWEQLARQLRNRADAVDRWDLLEL